MFYKMCSRVGGGEFRAQTRLFLFHWGPAKIIFLTWSLMFCENQSMKHFAFNNSQVLHGFFLALLQRIAPVCFKVVQFRSQQVIYYWTTAQNMRMWDPLHHPILRACLVWPSIIHFKNMNVLKTDVPFFFGMKIFAQRHWKIELNFL